MRTSPHNKRRQNGFLSDYMAWQLSEAEDNKEQLARLYRNLRHVREAELTQRQAEMIRLYYDE